MLFYSLMPPLLLQVLYLQARVYHRLSEVEPDPHKSSHYARQRNQSSRSFHVVSCYLLNARHRPTTDLSRLLHDLPALQQVARAPTPTALRLRQ